MKNLFWSVCLAAGLAFPALNTIAAEAAPETKKACIKTTDPKTGKEV